MYGWMEKEIFWGEGGFSLRDLEERASERIIIRTRIYYIY